MLPAVRCALIAHARSVAPGEACGLLGVDAEAVIRRGYPTRNDSAAPAGFVISPVEHHRVLQEAAAAGLTVGGIYHSHPQSPAVPSAADLAGGGDPDWVYLIVGLAGTGSPQVRAYRLRGGTHRPLVLQLPAQHWANTT
ncbi:MAG: Mov34/MPN/PAD-1 family protein [Acidimicrobiia bacterium]